MTPAELRFVELQNSVIELLLMFALRQGDKILNELTNLTSQVKMNTDAEASAIQLLNGLSAMITAAGTDPQKLASLTGALNTSGKALAAAVLANTPVADPNAELTNPDAAGGTNTGGTNTGGTNTGGTNTGGANTGGTTVADPNTGASTDPNARGSDRLRG